MYFTGKDEDGNKILTVEQFGDDDTCESEPLATAYWFLGENADEAVETVDDPTCYAGWGGYNGDSYRITPLDNWKIDLKFYSDSACTADEFVVADGVSANTCYQPPVDSDNYGGYWYMMGLRQDGVNILMGPDESDCHTDFYSDSFNEYYWVTNFNAELEPADWYNAPNTYGECIPDW